MGGGVNAHIWFADVILEREKAGKLGETKQTELLIIR